MANRLLLFEGCEHNICEVLAQVCQRSGFYTQEVTTVDDCMEAVRTSPPDVVLMITNNILEECAFDVAEEIRAVHPKCGFVFLAGCESDRRTSFLAAGYKFDVREIPLPMPELMAAISEAMASPSETLSFPKRVIVPDRRRGNPAGNRRGDSNRLLQSEFDRRVLL